MIAGEVRAFVERDPVQGVRREEHAVVQDPVQLEVGAQGLLVHGVPLTLDLGRVVRPVPGLERVPGGLGQRLGLGVGIADGGRGQPAHHVLHGLEVRCRLPVHRQLGEVREPQKARLLGAEPDHVLDQIEHIEAAAVAAAADRGLVEPPADIPVRKGGHGGLVAGLDQRQQELALVPGGPRGLGGAGDVVVGQAGEVGGVVQQQGSRLHAFLDALPELGAEPGKLGVDGLEPLLAGVVELDARGTELLEVFVHEPGGLRVQGGRVQRREAFVELPVEVDRILVGGEERGEAGLEIADGI